MTAVLAEDEEENDVYATLHFRKDECACAELAAMEDTLCRPWMD